MQVTFLKYCFPTASIYAYVLVEITRHLDSSVQQRTHFGYNGYCCETQSPGR